MEGEVKIKEWSNWGDGLGYANDNPDKHGFAGPTSASGFCLLGTRNELRPPPGFATAGVTLFGFAEFFFVEIDSLGDPYLFITDYHPQGTTYKGYLHKMSLAASTWGDSLGYVSYADRLARPERYRGNWYFTELASAKRLRRLGTSYGTGTVTSGNISTDTITDDTVASPVGGGHLALVNMKLERYLTDGSVSILPAEENPCTSALWGASFPVTDSSDPPLGTVGLLGAGYAYNARGLYSFNDIGQAGLVLEDLKPWSSRSSRGDLIITWKGGIVMSHQAGLFYVTPQSQPIPMGPDQRTENMPIEPNSAVTAIRGGYWNGLASAGEWLYTLYSHPNETNHFVLGASNYDRSRDPTNMAWQCLYNVSLPT